MTQALYAHMNNKINKQMRGKKEKWTVFVVKKVMF
jgi:hypothetical protein